MKDIYIDFKGLRGKASEDDARPSFLSVNKINCKVIKFSEVVVDTELTRLRYSKYTKAKKQKLLRNLKLLMSKNILEMELNISNSKRIVYPNSNKLEINVEEICLENKELSFR